MTTLSQPQIPSDLREVQAQFEDWRKTRNRIEPISESLWESAMQAATRHGVNPVAKALHLDYRKLKQHVVCRQEAPPAKSADDERSVFLEIPALRSPSDVGVVLELEAPDGAKLVVRLPPGIPV